MSKNVSFEVTQHFFDKETDEPRYPQDIISVSESRGKELEKAGVGSISDKAASPATEKKEIKEPGKAKDMLSTGLDSGKEKKEITKP